MGYDGWKGKSNHESAHAVIAQVITFLGKLLSPLYTIQKSKLCFILATTFLTLQGLPTAQPGRWMLLEKKIQ